MTSTPRDAGIPVLTEVIDLDSRPAPGTEPAEQSKIPAVVEPPAPSAPFERAEPANMVAQSAATVQPPAEAPPSPSPVPRPSYVVPARMKPLFPTRASQAPPAVRLPTLQSAEEAEAEAVATWTPEQWNRMEVALRERILNQLLLRVDAVLDTRVRDALADVLQASVTRMADELRASLKLSLADTIERAVQQEISRLQDSK
jgi:hypothetical protein